MSSKPNNVSIEVYQGQSTGKITSEKQNVASVNISITQGSIMSIINSTKEESQENIDDMINSDAINKLKKLLSDGCSLPPLYQITN